MPFDIIGVAIGAFITWLVSWRYYLRAGKELRQETERLRKLVTTVLRGLEESGQVKFARDAKGEITGVAFELHALPAHFAATGGQATLTVSNQGSK